MLLADIAATPSSVSYADPGFGLDTTFQLEPSQCSIKVSESLLLSRYHPTAQTFPAETADTAYKALLLDPAFGLETILQVPQFDVELIGVTPIFVEDLRCPLAAYVTSFVDPSRQMPTTTMTTRESIYAFLKS
jgi:hypothetical protein